MGIVNKIDRFLHSFQGIVSPQTVEKYLEGVKRARSASATFGEQELTRAFVLSPQTSKEKLKLSLVLLSDRASNPPEFQKWLEENPKRKWLMERIEAIKTARIQHILIPEDLKIQITNQFMEEHKDLAPRHQRDMKRLYSLIQAHALLNYASRKTIDAIVGRCIEANGDDALQGYSLYRYISDSNEMGLAPETFEVWRDLITPRLTGLGFVKREVSIWYRQKYGRNLNHIRLESMLTELIAAGLLYEDTDPEDHRKKHYYSILNKAS